MTLQESGHDVLLLGSDPFPLYGYARFQPGETGSNLGSVVFEQGQQRAVVRVLPVAGELSESPDRVKARRAAGFTIFLTARP